MKKENPKGTYWEQEKSDLHIILEDNGNDGVDLSLSSKAAGLDYTFDYKDAKELGEWLIETLEDQDKSLKEEGGEKSLQANLLDQLYFLDKFVDILNKTSSVDYPPNKVYELRHLYIINLKKAMETYESQLPS